MKKKIFKVVLFVIFVGILAGSAYFFLQRKAPENLYGPYEVYKVVDGDTIWIIKDGEKVKIRLIGVDAPESVHPDTGRNSADGEIVSDWMKELLYDTKVFLEYDVSGMDQYGRVLAYVYLSDGKTMVNELLLENGYAQVMTIQPNVKYSDEFLVAQEKARKKQKGFWKE